jgi:hypothetical protein
VLTTYVVNTYLRCLRAWGLVFAQKLSKDGLPDYHEVPARAWSQHCYAFGALRMSAAHLPNDSQFANHAGAPARAWGLLCHSCHRLWRLWGSRARGVMTGTQNPLGG